MTALAAQPLQALCERLVVQRDVLDMQVQALRNVDLSINGTPTADTLLALYLACNGAAKAAKLATEQGLRVIGATGKPRDSQDTDVFALLRGEQCAVPGPVDAVLHSLAKQHFMQRGGWCQPSTMS